MIGFEAIFATISPVTNPPLERPSRTSASTNASAKSPSGRSTANGALNSFNSPDSNLFLVMIPLESHIVMLLLFTPNAT